MCVGPLKFGLSVEKTEAVCSKSAIYDHILLIQKMKISIVCDVGEL